MSSKIVINIHTQGDTGDETDIQSHMANGHRGEDSVPAPPSMDAGSDHAGSLISSSAVADAPAPPADDRGTGDHDHDFDAEVEMGAGPPKVSDSDAEDMISSIDAEGNPTPPANHPDIAGDDTGMTGTASQMVQGGGGKPGPPSDTEGESDSDSASDDENGSSKSKSKGKGKKGSGGKKKK